jgi:hypothetical protein
MHRTSSHPADTLSRHAATGVLLGTWVAAAAVVGVFLVGSALSAAGVHEGSAASKWLSDPRDGLRQGAATVFGCPEAIHNTQLLQKAIDGVADGETLVLPPGYFDVECLTVLRRAHLAIAGSGIGKTVLRRRGFEWDCDRQGKCPYRTEIFHISRSRNITIRDITLDGNAHHLAIKGHGVFDDTTGTILSGQPQFPAFQGNSSLILLAEFCDTLSIHHCVVQNGFRWAAGFVHVADLSFERNVVDTGNLSTLFKGHLDDGGKVRHAHTSQDGLHLVNCRKARILHNTIHSEDSGIAVEAFPKPNESGWLVQDVEIAWNDVSSGEPVDASKRLRDEDRIYGQGLADHYVGCGAIDVFYNENWDLENGVDLCAVDNLRIHDNHLHHARMGVRVNNFTSVGPYGLDSRRHRMRKVEIADHTPKSVAGHADQSLAGIDHIAMDDNRAVFNPYGGVGICVRNTDDLFIRNNAIADIRGGIGIELRKCKNFAITDNQIDRVAGTSLSLVESWPGGNGIRIENDPEIVKDVRMSGAAVFDAGVWSITDNRIGNTAAQKILVRATTGKCHVQNNTDLRDATPRRK